MTGEAAAVTDRPQNPRVLVSAASLHGATAEIAQTIGQVLSRHNFATTVMVPGEVDAIDDYDAVWLFSSGPVGDPSGKLARAMGKDPADLPALLEAAHARDHRMFAGKLDRKHLSLPRRASLLVFRGLNGDFRDWADIRQWAEGIARQLTLAPR